MRALILLLPQYGYWLPATFLLREVRLYTQNLNLIPNKIKNRLRFRQLTSGVNLDKFIPVVDSEKERLRQKYNIDSKSKVILSIGHITSGRGLNLLISVAQKMDALFIFVSSNLSTNDEELENELKKHGIIVMKEPITNIEEIYQCADCFLFTVQNNDSAIGMPLSILEALSAGLPVVTTRFGMLPDIFGQSIDDSEIYFIDNAYDAVGILTKAITKKNKKNRRIAQKFSWRAVTESILGDFFDR